MTVLEYETMRELINKVDPNVIEHANDYADDCDMVGATKTAKYIRTQTQQKQPLNLDWVRLYLSDDLGSI